MSDQEVIDQLARLLAEERAFREDAARLERAADQELADVRDYAEKVGWERNDAQRRVNDLRDELAAVHEAYRDLGRAVAGFLPVFDLWAAERDADEDGPYTAALRAAARKAGVL